MLAIYFNAAQLTNTKRRYYISFNTNTLNKTAVVMINCCTTATHRDPGDMIVTDPSHLKGDKTLKTAKTVFTQPEM